MPSIASHPEIWGTSGELARAEFFSGTQKYNKCFQVFMDTSSGMTEMICIFGGGSVV